MEGFPHQDAYWVSTAEFVEAHMHNEEALLASRRFESRLANVHPYSRQLKEANKFNWAIVHKGHLNKVNPDLLKSIAQDFKPVFANEVFVVFSKHKNLPVLPFSAPHLSPLRAQLGHLQPSPAKSFKVQLGSFELDLSIKRRGEQAGTTSKAIDRQTIDQQQKPSANHAAAPVEVAPEATAAPPEPSIVPVATIAAPPELSIEPTATTTDEAATASDPLAVNYASFSTEQIKKLMEERFSSNDAYPMMCLWDEVRAVDLNQQVLEIIGSTSDKKILEIGCGIGGTAPCIDDCRAYIGTDLSEAAIAQANQTYGHKPNFAFIYMNAEKLEFPDNEFDLFIAKEVIEHIPDAEACLREAFRVLKPGGKLIITSPNQDSLHLRINRKLGHADFVCSIDHVKEFTFKEALEMVKRQGFLIAETGGTFLMPYWGVPEVDGPVRKFTDNDPEVVEIMRDLGKRVGGDYAFCFIISALKPTNS